MTRRHDEKGDETVAFRVPEKLAAGLRDRARWKGLTPSELMRQMVEQHLSGEQRCKHFDPAESFANNSESIERCIREGVKAALQVARGMIPAGKRMLKRGAA